MEAQQLKVNCILPPSKINTQFGGLYYYLKVNRVKLDLLQTLANSCENCKFKLYEQKLLKDFPKILQHKIKDLYHLDICMCNKEPFQQ